MLGTANIYFLIIFQTDFNYSSPYWTNNETFAVDDGLEGLSEKQTKLASYWNTPFNKICLGMKVSGEMNWISLSYTGSSFYHQIEVEYSKIATADKSKWMSLISGSRLQDYCNQEGFSMEMKNEFHQVSYLNVRVGFVANNQDNCLSCNTCIGFGISAYDCHKYPRNITCGNIALCKNFNDLGTDAFGYILVK